MAASPEPPTPPTEPPTDPSTWPFTARSAARRRRAPRSTGERLGDYVLGAKIGSGGGGVVFAAAHATLGCKVAIKVMAADHVSREQAWRFFNEARAAAAIAHPAIVDVFHVGVTDDGRAYLVMELLDGESLAARLHRRGRLRPDEAIAVARTIAAGLAAAHGAGIIHRDLKPANVFFATDLEAGTERVKLLDFGIAKLAGGLAGPVRTRSHAVLGTPAYMPPEQWASSASVDHRADLYALGCLLHRMLTGEPPFGLRSNIETAHAHQYEAPPSLRLRVPGLPGAFHELVEQLLAKEPDRRPGTAVEVGSRLAAIAEEMGRAPRRRRIALVSAVVAAVVASGLIAIEAAAPTAGGIGGARVAVAAAGGVAAAAAAPAPAPGPGAAAAPAPAPGAGAAAAPAPAPAPVPAPAAAAGAGPAAGAGADAGADADAGPAAAHDGSRRTRVALAETRTDAAVHAFHQRELRHALTMCESALALDPTNPRPLPVCAMASCRLHMRERARRYIERLPAARRPFFLRYCAPPTPRTPAARTPRTPAPPTEPTEPVDVFGSRF